MVLSGKLQTWYGSAVDGATVYTLAAYPEGRECVVALTARISGGADRQAIEHLIDTVEVDCGRVTSGPLSSPSVSASLEAADSPEASTASSSSAPASAGSQGQTAGPAYNFIEVPSGTPPCPLGLDEFKEIYGPNVTCGEGGGYVPATWKSPSLRFVILSPVAGIPTPLPSIAYEAPRLERRPAYARCAASPRSARPLSARSSCSSPQRAPTAPAD